MVYSIAQEDEYLGKRLWQWRTWIDAPDDELNLVEQVTWYLHYTFDPSEVTVNDRANRFGIERRGWGTFQIRADVKTARDNVSLSQWLQFKDRETEAVPRRDAGVKAPEPATRVFLSYGAEDGRIAEGVKSALKRHGYHVSDGKDISAGQPWQAAIQRMIRESDVVVGLVSSDYTSPFVISELDAAARSDKATIALLGEKATDPQGLGEVRNRVNLDLTSASAGEDVALMLEKHRILMDE